LTKKAISYGKENGAVKVWLDTTPTLKEAMAPYEKTLLGEDIYLYERML